MLRPTVPAEHVFEGQVIGDFFTLWLDQGKVNNQRPIPVGATQKVGCTWTKNWILNSSNALSQWTLNGKKTIFLQILLSELGNIANQDRLTIYLARPNRMKGAVSTTVIKPSLSLFINIFQMFTGNNATSTSSYTDMVHDEQLQSVKEMGQYYYTPPRTLGF